MTRLAPLLSIAATGCLSFIGVRSAPAPCTDDRVLPTLDAMLAAAGAGLFVASFIRKERTLLVNPLTGVLLAVPDGLSALYGYTRVSGCRAWKAAHAKRATPRSTPPVDGPSASKAVAP